MLKIKISDTANTEIEKCKIDFEESLKNIITYVPKQDLVGLDCVYVTDKPKQWRKHLNTASGAYFQKHKQTPAYIEIYTSRLLRRMNNPENIKFWIPLQNTALAQTLFHEVGHHFEKIRSHGIRKGKREDFAISYANNLLSKYITDNSVLISSCFEKLKQIADEREIPSEDFKNLKSSWDKEFGFINN